MSDVQLHFYRGSDGSFEFNWPSGDGGNLDLTGWTIHVFEASPGTASYIDAQIVTPSEGLVAVGVKWIDAIRTDTIKFRLQLSRDDDLLAFPEISISYK